MTTFLAKINWPVALRIILTEYVQNWPILAGLMFALAQGSWSARVFCTAVGAFGTAVTIAQTERIKLAKPADYRERPIDLVLNAVGFFIGCVLYVVYYVVLRSQASNPLVIDLLIGMILGGVVGLYQGLSVSTRRLDRQALSHAAGLMLASAAIMVGIGVIASSVSAIAAAFILCIPMTLIIVAFDYSALILQPRM